MKLHLISYPQYFDNEVQAICQILEQSNCYFHLRKPESSKEDYIKFFKQIPAKYHSKIILHKAYELSKNHEVAGLHFSSKNRLEANNYQVAFKSTSCHALSEIKLIANTFDSCFLSPIFPSISKKGYEADLNLDELKAFNTDNKKIQVVALGGINKAKISYIIGLGFDGLGLVGAIWGDNPESNSNYLQNLKGVENELPLPYCLSIAGHDATAGAGVLSDIKTFEAHTCYGLGVTTAITYQNDTQFNGVKWLSFEEIEKQLIPLLKFKVEVIKIGLVENFKVLGKIVNFIKQNYPNAKVIWDPILKASAGFSFHNETNLTKQILNKLTLITPNYLEYETLKQELIKKQVPILLKGGHRKDKPGTDTLILNEKSIDLQGNTFEKKIDKHGTGCVLSSAIAANLAKGFSMRKACEHAKKYVEAFIQSNHSNLGNHNYSLTPYAQN